MEKLNKEDLVELINLIKLNSQLNILGESFM